MNKNIFGSKKTVSVSEADVVNAAGGSAYAFGDTHALAQYAVTGCLNGTYYADAETQLDRVLTLASKVSPEMVGKIAVYAREHGFMKDMPALLLATLAVERPGNKNLVVFKQVFPRVIDSVKMLRNFVQVIRSGKVGRKSFGSAVKKQIQSFIVKMDPNDLFRQSIGNDPSLADIIKMVHPKPRNKTQEALFGYLLDKEFKVSLLPSDAKDFEKFKKDPSGAPPEINFQFLSNIKMSPTQWADLAKAMSWQTLRMNLNTLARNGAFDIKGLDSFVAERLRDPEAIQKAKVFPFQLLAAYKNAYSTAIPNKVFNALQDAVEIAVKNVPELPGKTVIAVDVSGSMHSPVTGTRPGSTSKVMCLDAASLMGAAILRKNDEATILPFSDDVHRDLRLNGRDSVMTNAQKLSSEPSGGTDCASVLRYLNETKSKADAIIYLSDNQSWIQSGLSTYAGNKYAPGTNMAKEWAVYKKRNPKAKLVLIDLQPSGDTQVLDSSSVLNVGGFSDRVFDIVSLFVQNKLGTDHWVDVISKIEL